MISIHSRVVHLSHLKEMSAIFSITTDINDISATQVLDRDFLLVLNVNQFLSRDQSREESGFNFWCRLGRQAACTHSVVFFNRNQILYLASTGCLRRLNIVCTIIGTSGNLCLPLCGQGFFACTKRQPIPVKGSILQGKWIQFLMQASQAGSLHSQCGLF